jgi:DNA-binding response OmpR family regulator
MDELKLLTALYVDDDENVRKTIGSALKILFKKAFFAQNGHEAFTLFKTRSPDIIVIDIEMPILDGIDLATKIREESTTVPIIVLTGYDKKEYLERLVTLGISSYLLKPITTEQITQALLKASSLLNHNRNKEVTLPSGYKYNSHNAVVTSKDGIQLLTPSEKKLLEKFLSHRAVCLDQDCLAGFMWGEKEIDKSAIRQLIKSLRKKIGASSIKTLHSSGYMMV